MENNATNNNTSSSGGGGEQQSFMSKYGLWVVVALILVVGFMFKDKIASMMAPASSSTSGTGGTANPPTPSDGGSSDLVNRKVTVPGNDYVSGDAINKVMLGNYEHYTPLMTTSYDKATPAQQYAYNIYNARKKELFGENKDNTGLDWTGAYVDSFFVGMDLKQRPDYLGIFKDYIQQYLDSPVKIPHWDTQKGQFRKSGVTR